MNQLLIEMFDLLAESEVGIERVERTMVSTIDEDPVVYRVHFRGVKDPLWVFRSHLEKGGLSTLVARLKVHLRGFGYE